MNDMPAFLFLVLHILHVGEQDADLPLGAGIFGSSGHMPTSGPQFAIPIWWGVAISALKKDTGPDATA